MKTKRLWITCKCLVAAVLLYCWSCYDNPVNHFFDDETQSDKLSVEEAHELFMQYYMNLSASRSVDAESSSIPLDPGIITPAWQEAVPTSNEVNSYVNVPVQTDRKHYVKSPYNEDWVEAPQRLVAVQDDESRRRNLYLMTVVPEGIFAYKQANAVIYHCDGAKIPKNFSGLIIYTKPQGGIPVYMAHYDKGALTQDVFLFDKAHTFQENVAIINSMLKGYHEKSVRNRTASLSRSEWGGSTGSNPDTGDDDMEWFYHPEGDPYTGMFDDGKTFTYWYTSDGKGNYYIVADMDGDGQTDTILNKSDAPVGGEGSISIGMGGGIGGSSGKGGSSSGGDVNPGGGSTTGGESGGKPGSPTINTDLELRNFLDLSKMSLTKEHLSKLDKNIKTHLQNYPRLKDLFIDLANVEKKLTIQINSKEAKGNAARYDQNENICYIDGEYVLSSTGIIEEFIHSAQYQIFYPPENNPGIRNIEFEAKMFYDMCCAEQNFYSNVAGMGFQDGYSYPEYDSFLEGISKSNKFTQELQEQYNNLGKQWNDPKYQKGAFNEFFPPRLIMKYFK